MIQSNKMNDDDEQKRILDNLIGYNNKQICKWNVQNRYVMRLEIWYKNQSINNWYNEDNKYNCMKK